MERRTSIRVFCGIPVEVHLEESRISAELMNISRRGMFLRGNVRAPMDNLRMTAAMGPDCEVILQFALPGVGEPLIATGCVARKSDMGVGVDFHHLSPPLSDFVDELARSPDDVPRRLGQITGTPTVLVRSE